MDPESKIWVTGNSGSDISAWAENSHANRPKAPSALQVEVALRYGS